MKTVLVTGGGGFRKSNYKTIAGRRKCINQKVFLGVPIQNLLTWVVQRFRWIYATQIWMNWLPY